MAESSPRDPGPEVFHDLPVGRLAGKDDLVGHLVSVDAVDSQLPELVQDKALAAGDPSGESDLEHEKMIAAWSPPLFFCNRPGQNGVWYTTNKERGATGFDGSS